jgi:hypothetical protein
MSKKKQVTEDFYLAFVRWWQPTGFDSRTGSEIGGHPDARRLCVSSQTKEKRYFGIRVETAWGCQSYRDEFKEWLKDGAPEREEVVTGNPLSRAQARVLRSELERLLGNYPF